MLELIFPSDCRHRTRINCILHGALIVIVCWLVCFRLLVLIHTKNFVADPTAKPAANAEILIYFIFIKSPPSVNFTFD